MRQTRRRFIKAGSLTALYGLSGMGFGFTSCGEDTIIDENNVLNIRGVSIPSSLDIGAGQDVVLTGEGFEVGDQIQMISSVDAETYNTTVTSITDTTVSFPLPEEINSGSYRFTVFRGSSSLLLGSVLLNLIANLNIPDVEGMTVKGVVYSDGKGISGVVVSDGYEVTVTNAEGVYYLPSLKKTGFVFISIPGNYEVANDGNAPQFFERLSNSASTVEQKNFSLFNVDNDNHVVIPMADWHLANRNNDLDQFTTKVLPDVNASIAKYAADGTKVYVLTLGDLTWELYWHRNNFALQDYVPYMNKLDCPVFNLIGNHDSDPYKSGDWESEQKFRDIIGPTYYSFNLGKIHYVVLDDVVYHNEGASEGVIGNRHYDDRIISDQIEWLKKDLATVADKGTPIVVATHTPLYKNPGLDANGNQVNQIALDNGNVLIDCLKDFSTVHVLTGHTHINYSVEEETSLMEHNTAAICATWWWTGKNGYAGNHICKDGTPGGYGIWKMQGRDINWLYKSTGYSENYQFRSYDLNKVQITAAKFAPNSSDSALAAYAGPYMQQNVSNEVLINVWGYDSQWQIEVKESGSPLDVTRIEALDPLHIISYEALRLNAGATPTGAFVTTETAHLFRVVASAPDSTLEIKVTDRFGNVYRESMVRPKAFSYDMK